MKLVEFNSETLPKKVGGGSKIARVSFAKAGTITFNKAASSLMELSEGDKVTLAKDEEDPDNWYFFKSETGFPLRSGYDKTGTMFNHSILVTSFRQAFDLSDDVSHSFIIAGKPTIIKGDKTKYWGILITKK